MDTNLIPWIQINLFLQSLGEGLVGIMEFFSFLGTEEFYLIVAPAILWCFNSDLGLRLGLMLMTSGSINSILKLAFHAPRPYWVDREVVGYAAETSFGVPSGHAQNAVVVWGGIAAWINKTWAWIAALLIIFFISFSRMYLGVHFAFDVLVGWLVGGLLLWAWLKYETRFLARYNQAPVTNQILLALIFSLSLILVGALIRLALINWTIPPLWLELSARANVDEPIAPLALSGLISTAAAFFGLALGGILLHRQGGLDAGGPVLLRLLRYIVGLVGVLVLWFGLGLIFPRGEQILPYLLRYVRYSLIGLWISGLAPLIFIRLNLARRSK